MEKPEAESMLREFEGCVARNMASVCDVRVRSNGGEGSGSA